MLGYGLTDRKQAVEMAEAVCEALGHGSNGAAVSLLLETAAQETHIGSARDRTVYGAGTGLCQFDHIGFVDVVQRAKNRWKRRIASEFNIHIDRVDYRELELSPLLSMVFCRLKYLLVKDAIPADLQGRAAYWKKYYNTELGKGTIEEYVKNAHRLAQPLLKEKA